MSNIYMRVETYNPTIQLRKHKSSFFKQKSFADFAIVPFKDGQVDDDKFYTKNHNSLMFLRIKDIDFYKTVGKPSFVTEDTWNELKKTPSCFLSGNKTIMPRVIFPTRLICDNGIKPSKQGVEGRKDDISNVFDWKVYEIDGGNEKEVDAKDMKKFGSRSALGSEKEKMGYVTITSTATKIKDTINGIINSGAIYKLNNNDIHIDTSGEGNNYVPDFDINNLVKGGIGGGICCLVLNFIPLHAKKSSAKEEESLYPKAIIELGDNIEVTVSETGDLVVDINGQKTSGQLSQAKSVQAPGQSKVNEKSIILLIYPVWNGLIISSGFQDKESLVEVSSVYCIVNNKISIEEFKDYGNSLGYFDFQNPKRIEIKTTDKVRIDWGEEIRVRWENCMGTFSYTPAFFLPECRWRVYFKDMNDIGDDTYTFKAFPVYAMNDMAGEIGIVNNIAQKIPDSEDVNAGTVYRMFEFYIKSNNDLYRRRSIETWGYIEQTIEEVNLDIRNNNGVFNLTSSDKKINLGDWENYIISASVQIGLDGSSGSIEIDKYAFTQQDIAPTQSVGGIRLRMYGGENTKPGLIFTGIAMGISDSVSETSDTWTIELVGIEKKLQDIRLVNIPFWDGDKVGDVAEYLGKYGGIEITFPDGTQDTLLPATTNIDAPYFNFAAGTPVIDALHNIAEESNHRFVINVYGQGEFHWIEDTGRVRRVNVSPTHTDLDGELIVSINNSPNFDNLYNMIWTAGVPLRESKNPRNALPKAEEVVVLPKIIAEKINTYPEIAWQKMLVTTLQGYLPEDKIEANHEIYKRFAKNYMSTGTMQIPGNADIKLFDKVEYGGKIWFVYEINHSIDFTSKTWTTGLSLALIV